MVPIDPSMLARYREAFKPSGAKDDPTDAALTVDLVVRAAGETEIDRGDNVHVSVIGATHVFGPDGERVGSLA